MKRLFIQLIVLLASLPMMAQGWPAEYEGVMLQAFYWDSFNDSQWTVLESQTDELSKYFTLVWIPQSGNCNGNSMGYDDYYWFPGSTRYKSSFGTEAELRSMISTFKEKGIGTIADVVINHRRSGNGWFGFPTEKYNDVTYKMTAADVCSNDDGGKAKKSNPSATLGNEDTGEDWDGMRDLDHTSENVQTTVKAYLHMLLEDLGYAGFRYDMVKGYGGEYTKIYNEDSNPTFSVGEYWDSNVNIRTWILKTGKTSAAFDFPFKYVVRNAVDNKDWTSLGKTDGGSWPLISNKTSSGSYRQYAVTFVENHDTEVRPDGSSNGPLKSDTLAANAFMLAMPGTPCVFLKHWQDCKWDIKSMIDVRNLMGIHNMSTYEEIAKETTRYAVKTVGKQGSLVCCVGNDAATYIPEGSFTKVLSGYHYAYWMDNSMETAWIDWSSGDFSKAFDATLSAVTTNSSAKLVYTTDGTTPSATNGTQVASGEKINISSTTTLTVGLLLNGTVKGIVSRTYTYKDDPNMITIPDFCTVGDGEICAFFEAPTTWTKVKCWAWDSKNYTGGVWPGVDCTKLGTANNGNVVWKWTFNENDYKGTAGNATQPEMIIFSNNGNDGQKTADLTFVNGGYYSKKGFFDLVTSGINAITAEKMVNTHVYTLDGRLVNSHGSLSGLQKGIYIVNGKKYVIK